MAFLGIIPGMARYPWNPKFLFQGGLPGRYPFLGSFREWRGILRILSNFSKGFYQVGWPFLGSSREWRGILRILSNFSKGVYQVGCPFLGSSQEWRGILRILSNFSKGVYQVGALSWDHPGNDEVSLET